MLAVPTKYSCFLLYKPVLPIHLKYNTVSDFDTMSGELDEKMFGEIVEAADIMRNVIHDKISIAQKKQKQDYDHRHNSPSVITVGEKVLLKNNKRDDRKGGKFTYRLPRLKLCPEGSSCDEKPTT